MSWEIELREAVNRLFDTLGPVVEMYGGLGPDVLVDLISDDLDLPRETIEAAIRTEAGSRDIPLTPPHSQTVH
ncbi:hypothetical protein [Aurantimonas endophytica]|uniref:Uncharacterized protein n=1 Tax=Aurantimonas endophytica TaxID=1522175 RepID=A0A7W6HDJ8_9HYPH|nr:hypothetical protein [Aurantimonas endophytica]MBB4003176.1 hypothetical protein [Aurantimonas endophytica]MCO6404045.1 hypothetical protein [Aurantimonas endophytica]